MQTVNIKSVSSPGEIEALKDIQNVVLGDDSSNRSKGYANEKPIVILKDLHPVKADVRYIYFNAVKSGEVEFYLMTRNDDDDFEIKKTYKKKVSVSKKGETSVQFGWITEPGEYLAFLDKTGVIGYSVDKERGYTGLPKSEIDMNKCVSCWYVEGSKVFKRKTATKRNYGIKVISRPSRFSVDISTRLSISSQQEKLNGHLIVLSKYRFPYSGKINYIKIPKTSYSGTKKCSFYIFRSSFEEAIQNSNEEKFFVKEKAERVAQGKASVDLTNNSGDVYIKLDPPVYVAKADMLAWYAEGENSPIKLMDTKGNSISVNHERMNSGEGMVSTVNRNGVMTEVKNTAVEVEVYYEKTKNIRFDDETDFKSPFPNEASGQKTVIEQNSNAKKYTLAAMKMVKFTESMTKYAGKLNIGMAVLTAAVDIFWKEEDRIQKAVDKVMKAVKKMIKSAITEVKANDIKNKISDNQAQADLILTSQYSGRIDNKDFNDYCKYLLDKAEDSILGQSQFEGEKLAFIPYFPTYGSMVASLYTAYALENLKYHTEIRSKSERTPLGHKGMIAAAIECFKLSSWLDSQAQHFVKERMDQIVPKATLIDNTSTLDDIITLGSQKSWTYKYKVTDNGKEVFEKSTVFKYDKPSTKEKEKKKKEWRKKRYSYEKKMKQNTIDLWDASYAQQSWLWSELGLEFYNKINLFDHIHYAEKKKYRD